MNYLSECGKLIHESVEKTYRVLNATKTYLISKEEFDSLILKKVKKQEFSMLLNRYFHNVKHEWEHQGTRFRKLDNFESSNPDGSFCNSLINNYEYSKLPKHDCGVYGKCLLVYHWGRIYYFTVSYGGYKQGQLLDIRTKSAVRWAQAKHCAPVFNCETKEIV